MKLGIVDWGIGGLSVLEKIQAARVADAAVYYSDAGARPYGKMTHSELHSRLSTIFDFFLKKNVDRIVIACNAASTAFMYQSHHARVPLTNVISPTIKTCQNLTFERLGVIGGDRTIEADCYSRIKENGKTQVFQTSAQPLSALVEAGKISTQETRSVIEDLMIPLLQENIQGLILACTHYPALIPIFKDLYPHLQLIDPAESVVSGMDLPVMNTEITVDYYTSGNAVNMVSSARLAFQQVLSTVEFLALD